MPSKKYKDLNILVAACMELVESQVGDLHIPDRDRSHVCAVAREVAELLVHLGCKDRALITAAALGDLPYTNKNLKKKVTPYLCAKLASFLILRKLNRNSVTEYNLPYIF